MLGVDMFSVYRTEVPPPPKRLPPHSVTAHNCVFNRAPITDFVQRRGECRSRHFLKLVNNRQDVLRSFICTFPANIVGLSGQPCSPFSVRSGANASGESWSGPPSQKQKSSRKSVLFTFLLVCASMVLFCARTVCGRL